MGNGQPKTLHDAVRCGNLQVIDFLLRSNIKLDNSIVAVAASRNRVEVANILIKAKADVNSIWHRLSAITWAGNGGNLALVKLLLEAKADMGAENKALVLASRKGHIKVVDFLLKYIAPVRSFQRCTQMAMIEAAKGGQTKVIETFLRAKLSSDTRKCWRNMMCAAACRGHLAVIKFLVEEKANAGDDLARPLKEAIVGRSDDVVEFLISAKANLEFKDKSGCTVLVNAIKLGASLQVIDLLIEASAELNLTGRNNPMNFAVNRVHLDVVERLSLAKAALEDEEVQPLHRAVSVGNIEMFEFLINAKVSLDVRDKKNRTALMWGVKKGRLEFIEMLIHLKADVNATDAQGATALCKATWKRYKSLELTKMLVNGKADIDVENYSALANVAWNGNIDTAKFLINAKANLELKTEDDCTALMLAARCGHHEVVALLLDAKAEFNSKDKLGYTASSMAAMAGHLRVIKALESAKADITDDNSRALIWAAKRGHSKVARYLVNAAANLENQDDNGRTAITIASKYRRPKVVKILIEAKADLNKPDSVGHTALSLAGSGGSLSLTKMLVHAKADINGGIYTALHQAVKKGHTRSVIFLLKAKADIERQTDKGHSALMIAAIFGRSRAAYYLLKKKADLNAQDIEGKTAAFWAGKRGDKRIVKMLLDARWTVD